MLKKSTTLLIWCLGSFVSTASGLGNALGYFVQAKVYDKSDPISLSYSVRRPRTLPGSAPHADPNQVVAATAGIAIGPLFAVPLGRRYGRAFYDRTSEAVCRSSWPDSFLANRMATFFCGARVIPPISMAQTVSLSLKSLAIGVPEKLLRIKLGDRSFFANIRMIILLIGVFSSTYSARPSSSASAPSRFSAAVSPSLISASPLSLTLS